jgi:hypothetical protein
MQDPSLVRRGTVYTPNSAARSVKDYLMGKMLNLAD